MEAIKYAITYLLHMLCFYVPKGSRGKPRLFLASVLLFLVMFLIGEPIYYTKPLWIQFSIPCVFFLLADNKPIWALHDASLFLLIANASIPFAWAIEHFLSFLGILPTLTITFPFLLLLRKIREALIYLLIGFFGKARESNTSVFATCLQGILMFILAIIHIFIIRLADKAMSEGLTYIFIFANVCAAMFPLLGIATDYLIHRIGGIAKEKERLDAIKDMYEGVIANLSDDKVFSIISKHDIMKNLRLMQEYIDHGSTSAADELLEKTLHTYDAQRDIVRYSNNIYINAFLNYASAIHPAIDIQADIQVKNDYKDLNNDLGVLLVCLFDAHVKMIESHPVIRLRMTDYGETLDIRIQSQKAKADISTEMTIIRHILEKHHPIAYEHLADGTTQIILKIS